MVASLSVWILRVNMVYISNFIFNPWSTGHKIAADNNILLFFYVLFFWAQLFKASLA